MARLEIHKFGGTSVAGAERLRAVAALLADAVPGVRRLAVTSAMAGVTDALVAAAEAAARGERDAALGVARELTARHRGVLDELETAPDAEVRAAVQALGGELHRLLEAALALGELTPRTRDRVVALGEKWAVRLLATALEQRGVRAVPLDADRFLETDATFGEATPLQGVAQHTTRTALLPRLEAGELPVVTGFLGQAPDGSTTTLGRGGSDLSATVLAAALGADEVTIWTDVDGVFTTDPRVVPDAQSIPQLNYREATELSYYGAKVLHQRTILPVAELGIPVRIRNSLAPATGTTVDGRFTPGSHPVKAISAVRRQALVSVEGKAMAGVPGIAARVFGALARRGISVTMISQSSSEASITLAVPEAGATEAELALKREFREDLSHGVVEEVVTRPGVGLVAAVGLGMAQTPGVAGRVLGALGARRVNVLAIAQGSSELNLSVAVDAEDVDDAIRAIHDAFGLHRLDTGDDDADALDLMLLGCGQIGRALVELVLERRAHLFRRFGLNARLVAVADRSGFLFRPGGLRRDELDAALAAKSVGHALAGLPGAVAAHPAEMVRAALRYRLVRPVLVDVSDADDSAETFREALRLGCDVVTANKKPLAGPLAIYQALVDTAIEHGRALRAEATVGAGLPVVDTLEMLLHTGDRLLAAEGALSGTLGYLMSELEREVPFSEAVAEAVRLGYTEPDPVADLSGVDVARKALILARVSGLVLDDLPVQLTGLVDPALAGLPLERLLLRLREYDEPLARQAAEARREGKTLRYLARVERGRVEVGLAAVPLASPLGALNGTDNLILFRSERYHTRPLVVIGPGAGVEVTAMGVLGDILRIAAERS